MSISKRTIFFSILIAIVSLFLWEQSIVVDSDDSLYSLVFVNLILIIISISVLRFKLLPTIYRPIFTGLFYVGIFYLIFFSWNVLFRWYSDNYEYSGNIFRGFFYGYRAPSYGHLKLSVHYDDYYPIYFSTLLFIVMVFFIKWNRYSKWAFPALMILGTILFFTFSYKDSISTTLLSENCHFKTFSEGLSFFPEWKNFLSSYVEQMKNLGAHNNHYPPGVLLLLKINNSFFPYLFKILVISAPIISLFPIRQILRHFSFSTEDINVYVAFYISSIALLFFPGKSITPLHILFASSFVLFLVKSIDTQRSYYGILAGISLSVYAFYSFSFLVFSLFCFIFLLSLLFYKKISIQDLLKPSLSILSSFILIYTLIYLLFDFNLIQCFNVAFQNEGAQMKSSGFDNITRYFIVSSGNLIAYVAIFSPLFLAIYSERISASSLKVNSTFNLLLKSVLISVFVLSFSSQFYLEVERIWIFLSPFVIMVVLLYAPVSKLKDLSYLRIALSMNILVALIYKIYLNNCG